MQDRCGRQPVGNGVLKSEDDVVSVDEMGLSRGLVSRRKGTARSSPTTLVQGLPSQTCTLIGSCVCTNTDAFAATSES